MRSKAMKAAVAAVAMLCLSVAGPLDAVALDKASFRLSWLISATAAPFYLGLDKGFYKAEGIDLTIEEARGPRCRPSSSPRSRTRSAWRTPAW